MGTVLGALKDFRVTHLNLGADELWKKSPI